MTTAYTSLLGLALPVTGELSGTWGDTVNTAITSLLDSAVAGTTSITTDADITLTTTTGAANQARQAIILWNPASGTTTRYITAPAQSKMYTVINASGGTQSIVIRGAGPTTGVTIAKGESAVVAWNGSDFVKVGSSGGAATFTDLTVTGNTILGDAAADTLTVNATSTFASPVNFQGLVKLPSTGRSAAAALTVTAPAFLYGVAATYTDTTSSGTIAAMAPFYSIAQPTLSTSNVTTYTNAATLYIANAPTTGGSATITNPYSLYVAAGTSYFGGLMGIGAAPASGYSVDITSVAASNNVLVRVKNTIASEDVGFNISGNYSSVQYEYSIGMNNGNNSAALNFWGPASASGSYDFWMNGTLMSSQTPSALTLKQNLLFSADDTYDIGASGATRPKNYYGAGTITAGGIIYGNATGGTNFIGYSANASGYASLRLYNDQNTALRALEMDYLGSSYSGSALVGGPSGEQGTLGTTGAYPLTLGTNNTARMFFSGSSTAVGIGRAPTTILDVYGTSPYLTVAASGNNQRALGYFSGLTSGGAAVTMVIAGLGDGSGQGALYTLTNHPLTFATNNSAAQMTLTTGGKLSIGANTSYAGTSNLYVSSATQDAASITFTELNTIAGQNGSITFQGYYNGTTTIHDSVVLRRYNGGDGNDSTYNNFFDIMIRPAGTGQSPAIVGRFTTLNGGGLILGNSAGTNTYDNNLYVKRSVSNIVNGAQENNAAATFGVTDNIGDAFIALGADQGSNKYSYVQSVNRSTGYLPLLLNPAGGYVGIGTGVSMPAYNLDVWGSSPGIRVKATSSAGGAQLSLDTGATAGYSNQIQFLTNGTSKWALGGKDIGSASGDQFSLYNYNTSSNALTIQTATNLTSINSASSGAMLYVNTAGYALTSGQSGAFLLVQSTGGGRPCIQVASSASGQDAAFRTVVTNGSTYSGWTVGVNIETGSDTMSWCYNSGQAGSIYSTSGTVYMRLTTAGASYNATGTWGTISDARLKENIVDATPKLANIMALRVRNYNMIADASKKKMIGLVAQEVEQVFPGLVEEFEIRDPETKEVTGTEKNVKMSILVPMLVKALQELKDEFDAYKASHP